MHHQTEPEEPPQFVQIHQDDPAAIEVELLQGLMAPAATTSPKFLYDRLGSKLFEAITELPEYYPTRTEAAIFAAHAADMARDDRPDRQPDRPGRRQLCQGKQPVPGACSRSAMWRSTSRWIFCAKRWAGWHAPIRKSSWLASGIDFSSSLQLPPEMITGRPVFFYPGSSIGNFTPEQASGFLRGLHARAGGGGLLIGVDLVKPASILEPAYDDALGVTAAFNLNMLLHLNRAYRQRFQTAPMAPHRHLQRRSIPNRDASGSPPIIDGDLARRFAPVQRR